MMFITGVACEQVSQYQPAERQAPRCSLLFSYERPACLRLREILSKQRI